MRYLIFILIALTYSCSIIDFGKGVKEDLIYKESRNSFFLEQLKFTGICVDTVRNVKTNTFILSIDLLKSNNYEDSIINSPFLRKIDSKRLIIKVDKCIYQTLIMKDTISKINKDSIYNSRINKRFYWNF